MKKRIVCDIIVLIVVLVLTPALAAHPGHGDPSGASSLSGWPHDLAHVVQGLAFLLLAGIGVAAMAAVPSKVRSRSDRR